MSALDYIPDCIQIPTKHGHIGIINSIDGDLISLSWNSVIDGNNVYLKYSNQRIHRLIMSRMLNRKLLRDEEVDHIDGDGLNNRRNNLRIATHAQNIANQKVSKNNSTGYKGVVKDGNKYRARIGHKGQDIHIGVYPTAELAARAYDEQALRLFGEFARLNF